VVAKRLRPEDKWKDFAACKGMDPEEFFPHIPYQGSMPRSTREHITRLINICRHECPVQTECRAYAKHFNITDGIWGGVLFNRRGRPSRQTTKEEAC
jgi:hypothetical protein